MFDNRVFVAFVCAALVIPSIGAGQGHRAQSTPAETKVDVSIALKVAGQLPQMPLSERQRLPEIRAVAPFVYAYLEYRGSYVQIPAKVQEFMTEFFKQKLTPNGMFFAMYLNSPAMVKEEDLQWRLGFPVAADAPVAAPLQKGEYNFTQVVYYLYIGPYDKVEYAYGKIASFMDQKGYKAAGPSIERYLDANATAVKPEELRTEVLMPVEKK
jgi:effector-binding domain-containing protein